MIKLLKKAFIEGYKQRAEASDLIFDETSEMYAEHIFEKWIKGQSLLIDSVVRQSEQLKSFLQEIAEDKSYIHSQYYKNKAKTLMERL